MLKHAATFNHEPTKACAHDAEFEGGAEALLKIVRKEIGVVKKYVFGEVD